MKKILCFLCFLAISQAHASSNLYLGSHGNYVYEYEDFGPKVEIASGMHPWGMDVDSEGNLYFGSTTNLYKYDTSNNLSIYDSTLGATSYDVAIDSNNNLYVATNTAIYKYDTLGTRSLFVSFQSDGRPDITVDSNDYIYLGRESNGEIYKYDSSTGSGALFATVASASGMNFGTDGNLYVASYWSDAIYQVTPGGSVSTYLSVSRPSDLVFDDQGNLYYTKYHTSEIIKYDTGGISSAFESSVGGPVSLAFYNGSSGPGNEGAIPEPATLLLIGLGLFGIYKRK